MTIEKIHNDPRLTRLALAIGAAITQHTMTDPMPVEDVIGVLGFCAGSAMGQKEAKRFKARELRQMCIANIDHGLSSALGAGKPLIILPN